MTTEQIAILALVAAMLAAFSVSRFRIELVALSGLAAAVLLGLVPAADAFAGFADPAVITVVEILIIVQVLKRSRLVEYAGARLAGAGGGERALLAWLCGSAALISVFMNNIGALALILPVAIAACESRGVPIARVLMPVSFATLLGGLCSVVGTPANLVVSNSVAAATGAPLAFFELGLVGVPLTVVGVAFLVFFSPRLLPAAPDAGEGERPAGPRRLVTELLVEAGSPLAGRTLAEAGRTYRIRVHALIRDGRHVFGDARRRIAAGDLLLAELMPNGLRRLERDGAARLARLDEEAGGETVEAVILPESVLVGSRLGTLESFAARGITVVGVSTQPARVEGGLDDIGLGIGDVLMLHGAREAIMAELAESGALSLASRREPALRRRSLAALGVFAAGIAASALGLASPQISFGAVVLVLALGGMIRLREAMEGVNWPIVLMLAAMIPVGEAIHTTGAAAAIASAFVAVAPGWGIAPLVVVVLLLAVLITPFVNNASTAVILAPIAAGIAAGFGISPTPLLVAVAVGASLDFLTPFGHHNNTLVMGIAGYRFADYPKLGAGLLAISMVVAVAAIVVFF